LQTPLRESHNPMHPVLTHAFAIQATLGI